MGDLQPKQKTRLWEAIQELLDDADVQYAEAHGYFRHEPLYPEDKGEEVLTPEEGALARDGWRPFDVLREEFDELKEYLGDAALAKLPPYVYFGLLGWHTLKYVTNETAPEDAVDAILAEAREAVSFGERLRDGTIDGLTLAERKISASAEEITLHHAYTSCDSYKLTRYVYRLYQKHKSRLSVEKFLQQYLDEIKVWMKKERIAEGKDLYARLYHYITDLKKPKPPSKAFILWNAMNPEDEKSDQE